MEQEKNPVRSVILSDNRNQIFLRAKGVNEGYPTHMPVRILVGLTVHLVQKCDVCCLALTLLFEPERKWRKCPHCNKANWSVWMPVSIRLHEIWDGNADHPNIYTQLKWYILCIHCANIVTYCISNPYALDNIKEYIYDPADDVVMKLWTESPPRRHRSSSSPRTS